MENNTKNSIIIDQLVQFNE